MRVFERGRAPETGIRTERDGASLRVTAGAVEARFAPRRVTLRKGGREWTVDLSE
jgi:hypothetical protein